MTLSIITINRNNAAGLRKTIESVVSQTYTDFEYIIIDGASTDDSVDVIKEYAEATLPCGEGLGERLYWISEPDKGIYNAMNKGILKAKGEYLLFLNSGDWLYDIEVIRDFEKFNSKKDIISGSEVLFDGKNNFINTPPDEPDLNLSTFFFNSLPHQATFIKRQLFEDFGYYDEKFKIVSDWDFFIKVLIINKRSYSKFDRLINYFDLSGISLNSDWSSVQNYERETVLKHYFPKTYDTIIALKEENDNLKEKYKNYFLLEQGNMGFIIRFLFRMKKVLRWFKKLI